LPEPVVVMLEDAPLVMALATIVALLDADVITPLFVRVPSAESWLPARFIVPFAPTVTLPSWAPASSTGKGRPITEGVHVLTKRS